MLFSVDPKASPTRVPFRIREKTRGGPKGLEDDGYFGLARLLERCFVDVVEGRGDYDAVKDESSEIFGRKPD